MIVTPRPGQYRWGLIGFLFTLVLIALIKIHFIVPRVLDLAINQWFSLSQTPFGNGLLSVVTFLGSPAMGIVYTLLLFAALLLAGLRVPALWTVLTVLSGLLVNAFVKSLVGRLRPAEHLVSDTGFSFPSTHVFITVLIVVIFFVLIFPNMQRGSTRLLWQAIAVVLTIWVMVSRLYLQAQYFTDVLAGAGLALAWGALMVAAYPRLARWLTTKIPFFKNDEI